MAPLVLITEEGGSASTPLLVVPAGESATLQAAETAGSCHGPGAVPGGDRWCGPGGTRHLLTTPPSPSAQSRSHSGGKDHSAASTPAPAVEPEQHSQLLSPVDLRGSRALIRGDEAGVSLVLSATLPIGNTYWATRVIPLTLRSLLTFAQD